MARTLALISAAQQLLLLLRLGPREQRLAHVEGALRQITAQHHLDRNGVLAAVGQRRGRDALGHRTRVRVSAQDFARVLAVFADPCWAREA